MSNTLGWIWNYTFCWSSYKNMVRILVFYSHNFCLDRFHKICKRVGPLYLRNILCIIQFRIIYRNIRLDICIQNLRQVRFLVQNHHFWFIISFGMIFALFFEILHLNCFCKNSIFTLFLLISRCYSNFQDKFHKPHQFKLSSNLKMNWQLKVTV